MSNRRACQPWAWLASLMRVAASVAVASALLLAPAHAQITVVPGVLGTQAVKWNFTKFLVGKDGQVLKRYAPNDAPESMRADIEKALAA